MLNMPGFQIDVSGVPADRYDALVKEAERISETAKTAMTLLAHLSVTDKEPSTPGLGLFYLLRVCWGQSTPAERVAFDLYRADLAE